MANIEGAIHCTGKVQAEYGDRREISTPYVALRIKDATFGHVAIIAAVENAERFRLAAAAINGELGDIEAALKEAFFSGYACGQDGDDRPFAEQAEEAWQSERETIMGFGRKVGVKAKEPAA